MSRLAHNIDANDVNIWVGDSNKILLGPTSMQELVGFLNGLGWPGDPEPPCSMQSEEPCEDERWWDFDAASKAAQQLIESLPKIKAFQKCISHRPETSEGYNIVCELERWLEKANPLIIHPFEPPPDKPRLKPSKRYQKAWHVPAVMVVNVTFRLLSDAGQPLPALSRNSIMVRVVQKALSRMGYGYITTGAIAAHLERWDQDYGLFRELTTNS